MEATITEILTERLALVAGTPEMLRAELRDPQELGALLDARMPDEWPPALYDRAALEFWLWQLEEHPELDGWCSYYMVRRWMHPPDRVLVGVIGYKGSPGADGVVEIGYSVVAEHQRRGYASEAVRALVARAFGDARVECVMAETLPALVSSIGVLEKTGFRLVGEGSEPGVIRYELHRDDAAAIGAMAPASDPTPWRRE